MKRDPDQYRRPLKQSELCSDEILLQLKQTILVSVVFVWVNIYMTIAHAYVVY